MDPSSPSTPSNRFARSLAELGEALGVSKARAGQLSKEPWFPRRGEAGWDVDACLLARAQRSGVATSAAPASTSQAVAPPPTAQAPSSPAVAPSTNELIAHREQLEPVVDQAEGADARLLEILDRSTDLIEVARVTALLAAKAYARNPRSDDAAETLHAALDMRRKMENDGLDLAKKRGEVIERALAIAVVGAYCRRFVQATERLAQRFGVQVELYLAEQKFRDATAEERSRIVREWVRAQMRAVRLAEKDEDAHDAIGQLVALELERRATRPR